jgi:hypothetical protein
VKYIPPKRGTDSSTQVAESELLDFDTELKPVLDFLIKRTIDTAVYASEKECDLDRIQKYQREYENFIHLESQKGEQLRLENDRLTSQSKRKQLEYTLGIAESAMLKIISIQISRDLMTRILGSLSEANLQISEHYKEEAIHRPTETWNEYLDACMGTILRDATEISRVILQLGKTDHVFSN